MRDCRLRRLAGLVAACMLFLSGGTWAQQQEMPLPPPPPRFPEAAPGQPPPFSPDSTREATVEPELRLELPGVAPDVPGELTLAEAIRLAWQRQPDVEEARGRLRQSEGFVVQQRSGLLPSVSVNSTYSHITTNSAGGGGGSVIIGDQVVGGGGGSSNTTDRLSTRFGFRQLLFDFGRTRNLVLQADLQRQSAAAGLLVAKNDVALNVKESFYSALQSQRLREVREDDLDNRRQQLELARALYEAGEMSPGDVVRAQSAVTNSVVNLNSARLEAESARQELLRSLGLSPLASVAFERFREPDLPSKALTYLLDQALDRRPDLVAARKEVEAGEAGLGAAYALNKPELSTFTGVTYQGALDGIQVPTLTAQLSVAFDLYDGGARAGAVTAAEGALQVSQARYDRTLLNVQRLVGGALAELTTAERNVEAARAGVESAREGVRIAEGRYRVALGSLTDVLDAQTAFVQARINLVNSQAALNLARSRARHVLAAPFEEGFVLQD